MISMYSVWTLYLNLTYVICRVCAVAVLLFTLSIVAITLIEITLIEISRHLWIVAIQIKTMSGNVMKSEVPDNISLAHLREW
jgi:hypothetical protein